MNFKTNKMESIKTISELNTEKKQWEAPMLKTNASENTEVGTFGGGPEGFHSTTTTFYGLPS